MKNVRKLTEGAILLAAFTVLLLITIYIPLVGSIINIVLPAPFIIFTAKNNIKNIAAFFVASIVISFIAASFMGLAMMLIYGTTGVIIGYMLQKNKSRSAILIASTLTIMAGMIIFFVVTSAFMKMDITHELQAALNQSLKQSEEIAKSVGKEGQIEQLKKQVDMVITLLPSVLILGSIVASFIIQWVCFPIAKRFGVNVEPWGSLRNLSLPRSMLWYLLIALGANLLVRPEEGTYLFSVLTNAIYILGTFMVVQGLGFLFNIFHQRSIPKGIRVLVVILAFMIPIIHYIIMILGITDIGFDLRKRFAKKE
ncbi:YybS family protein [Neobacillus drentensis]|uniref:YybS family protein n=1 Tax=Neobacillus drentensis TaxID=220684 RepID=UPI0030025025